MITVEDLRNSLRMQLGALVELYERDAGTGRAAGGPRAAPAAPSRGGQDGRADDATRAGRIESCLVDFDAALRAAARADRVREDAQTKALAALERSVTLQRRAGLARRAVDRALLAAASDAGRRPRVGRGPSPVERARAEARLADAAARGADAAARRRRAFAEATSRSAMAALLAAIQADPARGNPRFDPEVARAARTVAERAAGEAEATSADADAGAAEFRGSAVVVRLTPARGPSESRSPGRLPALEP
jgi:hypothetical protein